MTQIFSVLLNLLRLRPGPQHLPGSVVLLLILFMVDAAVSQWVQSLGPGASSNGLLVTVAGFACAAVVSWLVLSLRGHRERLLQTLNALLLIGIAFTLMSAPLLLTMGDPQADTMSAVSGAQALLFLVLVFWSLFATGSIFRYALSTSLAGGVLVAVIILLVQTLAFDLLLPASQ